MTHIWTSNQLSGIYGKDPTEQGPSNIKVERGYIVYLEIMGPNGGLFARTFWTKYKYENAPADHENFVKQIMELANAGELAKLKADKTPFQSNDQHYFSADISQIHFGWKACNVTYILNDGTAKFSSFYTPDALNKMVQPIVFRRDKVVDGKIEKYIENNSFFDLKFDDKSYSNATMLHFTNYMLIDHFGTRLGDPPLDAAEMSAKEYLYCLDIPIKIDQKAASHILYPALAADERDAQGAGLLNAITFVFDPPQGNGGGNGPPNEP